MRLSSSSLHVLGLDTNSWLLFFSLLWILFPFPPENSLSSISMWLCCHLPWEASLTSPGRLQGCFFGPHHTVFILWHLPSCPVALWPLPGHMLTEDKVPALLISVASGPRCLIHVRMNKFSPLHFPEKDKSQSQYIIGSSVLDLEHQPYSTRITSLNSPSTTLMADLSPHLYSVLLYHSLLYQY